MCKNHLTTRLSCSLLELPILTCTPNIKFAWPELPGKKYSPNWDFLSALKAVPAVLCK